MVPGQQVPLRLLSRRMCVGGLLSLMTACSGIPNSSSVLDSFSRNPPPAGAPEPAPVAAAPIGAGAVRVGLILPLSAGGNAGTVALSMKNAAEMALAEFSSPNVQLLVKDDAGTSGGAQQAVQQALAEGAEIIVGPLFAHAVGVVGAAARQRGVPVIAFSTDASVAARGVYLLSFLPESDVDRIVDYAMANGKRSFAALLSEGAYGNVVEAEFKQVVARKGGRIVALERYGFGSGAVVGPARLVAQAARSADAIFIPEGPEVVPTVVQALLAANQDGRQLVDTRRVQLLGTGLWDDPRIFNDTRLHGGWYAAPDSAGFRNFSARHRQRYSQDPVRTATLAYDAVALIAALVKTQGAQRFSEQVLTNASGFAGIDGLFRFRTDGTNERGLSVMQVGPTGGQVIGPPPRAFGSSGY
ncbi:MAG: penicillin-binding protein activator [Alphaproteobacteria bacterium]|nr:penicillin-binding protein activator [Alphaproteobacteria bacterium]